MSRERSISLTKWEGYGEYFPKFRSMLKEALRLVLSKLTVKVNMAHKLQILLVAIQPTKVTNKPID